MMKQAVLFDFDDTLYHYAPCHDAGLAAAHEVLRAIVPVDFQRFTELHDAVRLRLAKLLKNQAASHNRLLFFKALVEELGGRPLPDLILDVNEGYWKTFFAAMKPAPSAESVLDALKKSCRLGLITNQVAETQLNKLKTLGWVDRFDVIVTSEEAGVEKPDPAIFELALTRLKLKAADVIFVGDQADGDIAGARAVGIETVLSTEFAPLPTGQSADHVISELSELLEILNRE